jgi:hypothetical protein
MTLHVKTQCINQLLLSLSKLFPLELIHKAVLCTKHFWNGSCDTTSSVYDLLESCVLAVFSQYQSIMIQNEGEIPSQHAFMLLATHSWASVLFTTISSVYGLCSHE